MNKRIDMSPTYQRRADIWSKWKKSHLIDSIINDFDIPKFYIANFSVGVAQGLNQKKSAYAIIDGKQRMGAIFEFFADQLPLNPTCVLDDDPSIKLGGMKYSDLVSRYPAIADKVDKYLPTVMDVAAETEHKLEELFVRLNMGEATTGAERRNAMGGPIPVITRELSLHPFFVKKIRFTTKRMQEHNLIAKILLFEFKDGFADSKAKNLDDFAKQAATWFDAQDNVDELPSNPYYAARDKAYVVLERLSGEFEENDRMLARQGEIPIYYWIAREEPRWINELRDFILEFSAALLENVRVQRADPDAGSRELNAYYTAARTTNDQSSLETRYKIFRKRFAEFRRPGRR
ncbi:DUF262 domain-containing protein [Variovorax sp. dw_954]|uniref:DUF262 domain-containing protein n=1 Tax=Variovorax sp. dw_954 TaxID=2720078 RepID=UPI001BD563F0|nr:DUF262 domain-containing protein [Variovorax sp. dw_954]